MNFKTGKKISFDIPGLAIPGTNAPVIQGWVLAERIGGVILVISGGDKASWPRDGNRPLYFWLDLTNGRVVQMPIGYDLDHLSADQTVAIFDKPYLEKFKPRDKAALHLGTGDELKDVQDRTRNDFTIWYWEEDFILRGIRAPESSKDKSPASGTIVGLSIPGKMWRLNEHFDSSSYLKASVMRDGWVALQRRQQGDSGGAPSALYCGLINEKITLKQMSTHTFDFKLLDGGRCVYIEDGYGMKGDTHEVWVGDASNGTRWNILEGIQRLPALTPDQVKNPVIEDKTRVQLTASFDSEGSPRLVLCQFKQFQGSMSGHVFPGPVDYMPGRWWKQMVIVGHKDRRVHMDFLDANRAPEHLWLHGSGRLFQWSTETVPGTSEITKIMLQRIKLDMEAKPE